MSQQITAISLEAIQYMCGLIRDLASVSEAINNTNLADDKVFSNLYTKKLIDKCLEDANTEAQKLVGALTYLTCEETTVQPTLDNSSINVIYLYSATGNAPYQQYLKISDTKLIDLGSSSVSLSAYLTATEIARDYVTKLDFDALKTEVKGKVDKTSILTTIDNLATDDQVYSAKATYDLANTKANTNHTHTASDITDLSIPTKVSDLENDRGYLTSIPEEYITEMAQLETQVNDLFQSVSSGKTLVANAITGKGVSTSTTATFATMATNISKIITTYKEETKSYNNTSSGTTRLVFTFSADVSGVKQVTPPFGNNSCYIVPETLTDMFTINGKELILYVHGSGTWKVTALIKQ